MFVFRHMCVCVDRELPLTTGASLVHVTSADGCPGEVSEQVKVTVYPSKAGWESPPIRVMLGVEGGAVTVSVTTIVNMIVKTMTDNRHDTDNNKKTDVYSYFVNEHNINPVESYVYYDNLPVTLCFNLSSCRGDISYRVDVKLDNETTCIGHCGERQVFRKSHTHCRYDDTTGVVTVQTEQTTKEVTLKVPRDRNSFSMTKVVLLQKEYPKIISFTLSLERKNTGEKTSDDDDDNNNNSNNSSISNDISSSSSSSNNNSNNSSSISNDISSSSSSNDISCSSSSSSSSSNVPIYVEEHSMVTLKCQWYPGKPARNANLRRNGILVLSPQPDHHRHPAIPALNGTREMTHTIEDFTAKDDGVYICGFETETNSVISSRSLWIRESSENRGPSWSLGPWFEGLGVGLAVGLAVLVVVLLVLLLYTGPYEQLQQRYIGLRSEYSVMSHPTSTSSDARDTGPYEQLQQRDIGLISEYSVMSHPAPTSSDARETDGGYEIPVRRPALAAAARRN
ncbi:hypothetical protein ACOMHN_050724 [Nucella lapillus]